MRIFDIASYNLNKMRFKDNKEFFDDLLKELGITYNDVSFMFSGSHTPDVFQKLLKKYPEFQKYLKQPEIKDKQYPSDYELSSVSTDWDIENEVHIAPEDINTLEEILQKIPHTYNYWSMTVMLDNVHWQDEINTEPMICPTPMGVSRPGHQFSHYHSNHIKFTKEFDYGNKYNPITISAELQGNTEWVSDAPEGFERLIAALGKPQHRGRGCFFDDDETAVLTAAKNKFKELIKQDGYEAFFTEFQRPAPKTADEILHAAIDSVTPLSGISPKKIFTEIGKKFGFKYKRCQNQMYTLSKEISGNHTVTVEFLMRPFSKEIGSGISAHSYNFTVGVPTGSTTIFAESSADIERLALKTFECADEFIKNHEQSLIEYFGNGIDWKK